MSESHKESIPPIKCGKCGADFSCLADNISACHCSGVQLTRPQRQYIEERWRGCLCGRCLAEIASRTMD